MTEELTEGKNGAGLNEEGPLFTEVRDAILNVVHTAPFEEQLELAKELATCAVTIAKWAGYVEGINEAKQLAKDVITEADQQLK